MKHYLIFWPRFLAFLNLLAAVVCFVWHMLGARYPWPGNAVLLLWLALAIAGFAVVADAEEDPR